MSARPATISLVGALFIVLLAACGGGDDTDDAAATTAPAAVTTAVPTTSAAPTTTTAAATGGTTADGAAVLVVQNYTFAPLSVPGGTLVRLDNKDSEPHNISSPDGAIVFDGATETFTAPAAAGTYNYVCGIHAFMKGTLTVTA